VTPADAGRPASPSGAPSRSFWERSRAGWHVVTAGLLGVVLFALLVERPWDRETVLGLVALTVLAGAYLLVGRHALGADRTRFALLYLVPAWLAFAVLVTVTPSAFVLLFLLFPQIWVMVDSALVAVAATLLACLLLYAVQVPELGVAGAATAALVNAGLSILLGLWITGIVRESDRRAELIDELTRTRAELAAAEHERGVLAERERMAGEIHDTLAQGFTSVLALAQALEVEPDPARRVTHLALLQQTARENLAEARGLVAALGPVGLEESGLEAAVGRLVERFTAETGLDAQLRVAGDLTGLPRDREVVLLRAAQEALTNVRRHAGATRVRLVLEADGRDARLTVEDDGRGFPTSAAPAGVGLATMRHRAEAAGGHLDVGPGPVGGARLVVTVPAEVPS
jgi:signal transduction histidine kinase